MIIVSSVIIVSISLVGSTGYWFRWLETYQLSGLRSSQVYNDVQVLLFTTTTARSMFQFQVIT